MIGKACTDGPITYCEYIELALYADDCGYYTRNRQRVGRHIDRDFYTAESLGEVFAHLVATASQDLLPAGRAETSNFIEIAAEPEAEMLNHLEKSPFAASQVIRPGDAIQASGPVVIFANEWLDALPFHRLIYHDAKWHERGVAMTAEGKLTDVLLDQISAPVAAAATRLPLEAEEGYQLDLPLAAESALEHLLAQSWHGLLLLFDYGKSWQALLHDCPNGTARTYFQHAQGDDLLEQPGERDITCDICWDPLKDLLQHAGMESVTLESQESFFVQRAQRAAAAIVSDTAGNFSAKRQTLMELIHPAHMGQRFQVLWGIRKG